MPGGTSSDPVKRARSRANLRNAPAAPAGNQRAASPYLHRAERLWASADVSGEVRELTEALAAAAPVREADGSLPAADEAAVERAARALKRWRHLSAALDLHGRVTEAGDVKPAAEYELRAERALAEALDALGMTPTSRARLGVDLARSFDLAKAWAQEADVVEGEARDG
jgi:hypothetical protein